LTQAANLYCGELLEGFHLESLGFQEWLIMERESLHRQAMEIFYQLAAYYIQQHEYDLAQHYARRQLKAEPWREEAHRQLMVALSADGQRSAAMAQYHICCRILDKELGVEPETETRRLYETIRDHTFSITPPHNLPNPPSSFIGRVTELKQVLDLINKPANRLLTLTGVGGVGKTRLALEVGRQMLAHFTDGVWFVSLAALSDSAQVLPAIASVLGVREDSKSPLLRRLSEFLRDKHLLLILDNCEHLTDAVTPLIETLLQATTEVQIIVTSRKILGISAEVVYALPPFPVPEEALLAEEYSQKDTDAYLSIDWIKTLAQCESILLFVARASARSPTFATTRANILPIGKICRLLAGLPLAIELAATHINALTPQQMLERLQDAFWLLTQKCPTTLTRHQTLQAALDWSYALLTAEQRILLRRLSIFVGNFTQEAAQAVCNGHGLDPTRIPDSLRDLVNASLVMMESVEQIRRYRLHEVIRQYASFHLAQAGEERWLRKRHLDFYCKLAEALEGNDQGGLSTQAFDQLKKEYDNLQSALEWSLHEGGDPHSGLRLAAALADYWEARGQFTVERIWLKELLHQAASASSDLQAKALRTAARLAYYQGDFAVAQACFEQSAAIDRALGNHRRLADTLGRLGFVFSVQGNYTAAQPLYQESLNLYQQIDEPSGIARTLSELGYNAFRQGALEQAHSLLERSLMLFHKPEDLYLASRAKLILGHIARLKGDHDQARSYLSEGITDLKQLGNVWGILYFLEAFAHLAMAERQITRAVCLFSATERLSKTMECPLAPAEKNEHDGCLTSARCQLDEATFIAAWNSGQAMTLDEAIAYALEKV